MNLINYATNANVSLTEKNNDHKSICKTESADAEVNEGDPHPIHRINFNNLQKSSVKTSIDDEVIKIFEDWIN